MKKAGFTVLELVIAVIILAILVSIAIPTYIVTMERTRANEAIATLRTMHAAERTYFSERRIYTDLIVGDDDGWTTVGLENPNNNNQRSFNYEYSADPAAGGGTATRISGPNSTETITISHDGVIDDSSWTPEP